jgi:DNA-binding transcriptional ArsR family regulator
MSDEPPAESDLQSVLETLADPECRMILDELDNAYSAQTIAEQCELPQTSTYRKLQALREADLVEERTRPRSDGHHVTTYVRDVSGVFVLVDDSDGFEFEFVRETQSADERLAQFWSRISEEL